MEFIFPVHTGFQLVRKSLQRGLPLGL